MSLPTDEDAIMALLNRAHSSTSTQEGSSFERAVSSQSLGSKQRSTSTVSSRQRSTCPPLSPTPPQATPDISAEGTKSHKQTPHRLTRPVTAVARPAATSEIGHEVRKRAASIPRAHRSPVSSRSISPAEFSQSAVGGVRTSFNQLLKHKQKKKDALSRRSPKVRGTHPTTICRFVQCLGETERTAFLRDVSNFIGTWYKAKLQSRERTFSRRRKEAVDRAIESRKFATCVAKGKLRAAARKLLLKSFYSPRRKYACAKIVGFLRMCCERRELRRLRDFRASWQAQILKDQVQQSAAIFIQKYWRNGRVRWALRRYFNIHLFICRANICRWTHDAQDRFRSHRSMVFRRVTEMIAAVRLQRTWRRCLQWRRRKVAEFRKIHFGVPSM